MPITRHLILPRGLFRRSELPPHPLPQWSDVRKVLAALGLTVTRTPGQIILAATDGDSLYMAGSYPTIMHVIHRLMAVTTRLLVRALQIDAARTRWRQGDDVTRNQMEVWADQPVGNFRSGPFDAAVVRRIRRAMQVSTLPADWLSHLPELAAVFPLSTPMRTQLRALLRVMAHDALAEVTPLAIMPAPERKRL